MNPLTENAAEAWPELPLGAWRDTLDTLHLRAQMVGKTQLALAPMLNHWWHVALHLTARGLTTRAMPAGERTLEIEFDFIDHRLVARMSNGAIRTLALGPGTVADFYGEYQELLAALGVGARIWPVSVEMPEAIRFPEDRGHAAYDADTALRLWRILDRTHRVLERFRGQFLGKCSPAHFWWGGFDIACTRFSGRKAPPHPGGVPHVADFVNREAYSHECISAGWWPGNAGGPVSDAAFYAYAYPEPDGCATATIRPQEAGYHPDLREWILPYAAVRRAADPDSKLLEFLQSTYETAADLGGWDRAALERAGR
jgi:hypothetical protein